MAVDFWTGKRSRRLWLATIALSGTLLRGQKPSIPPADNDPFVGQWKANVIKSKPRLGKHDGSYETIIKREGDYVVYSSSQWFEEYAGFSSKVLKWQYKLLCDGRSRSSPIRPTRPTNVYTSCAYVAPNRVEGETEGWNLNLGTTFWTREVSPDGQETIIFNYEDKKRTRLRSVQVLDRVN